MTSLDVGSYENLEVLGFTI